MGRAGGARRRPLPRRRRVAGTARTISWDLLVRRVHELAVGLADHGVAPGDRVALLVPPGADLTAAAHACWRAGASVVVADPGLGAAGLARALRGAHPAHVVGALPGLALAAALGVPGQPDRGGTGARAGVRVAGRAGRAGPPRPGAARRAARRCPPRPGRTTRRPCCSPRARRARPRASSTGTGRPVRSSRRCAAAYGITADDRLVAAFPPFALYGPALGIASAVPAVRKPGALTAAALADAVAAVDATMVFASPAALRNVVATAADAGRGAARRPRRASGGSSPPARRYPRRSCTRCATCCRRRRRTRRTG